ncbi:MAG: AAA family ATPase [Myxococcota bacterium]
MYLEFYGLSEKPFALLPDPRFLFLSRAHREALAHLLYGIGEGEGFMQVVGPVGTGKTTLCRSLAQQLGDDVSLAFIFNPSSSESELLAAINREFGVAVVGQSRDQLIEELNRFLLAERIDGRRALLVIDEAQNLETGVLERIRLLSNLETEREKLLQIVLTGQPELESLLARPELRQLQQRITVRWSLAPFSRSETAAYLEHRLDVAGAVDPRLFSPAAARAIHRRSRGVPRLINALADRALLAGYAAGSRRITRALVRRASRELPAVSSSYLSSLGLGSRVAASLVLAGALTGLVIAAVRSGRLSSHLPAVAARISPSAQPASTRPPPSLDAALRPLSAPESLARSLDALLEVWGYRSSGIEGVEPDALAGVVAGISPLRIWETHLSPATLVTLGLPAIAELDLGDAQTRFAAVVGLEAPARLYFLVGGERRSLTPDGLARLWTGRVFIPWTNYESLPELTPGMRGRAVLWLQQRLAELGLMAQGTAEGRYDAPTRDAVERLQREHGLEVTGAVGPGTLITLYRMLRYGSPHFGDATS